MVRSPVMTKARTKKFCHTKNGIIWERAVVKTTQAENLHVFVLKSKSSNRTKDAQRHFWVVLICLGDVQRDCKIGLRNHREILYNNIANVASVQSQGHAAKRKNSVNRHFTSFHCDSFHLNLVAGRDAVVSRHISQPNGRDSLEKWQTGDSTLGKRVQVRT